MPKISFRQVFGLILKVAQKVAKNDKPKKKMGAKSLKKLPSRQKVAQSGNSAFKNIV